MLLYCGAAVLLLRAAFLGVSKEQAAVAQQDAAPQPAAFEKEASE